ncbi:hypothetical protein KSF_098840 [Reticulibacter mediterranei]|uniref:Uncharacterized protein n=1 Tax=Reticulibacter mediterranei TaxID=2778369 RepID=A0A8J3IS88_9CHLR|nr:hypothetical protein [Reticulibacter mediterranei]GHO99836.1 hypothetical protein KSF_098840 [Reticulibacter mediterranei]
METIMLGTQFLSILLWWIGIFLVAERATISTFQKRFVQMMSAIFFIAWLAVIDLLARSSFFNTNGANLLVLLLTSILGFSLFFSQTFRKLLAVTPMHWIIGFQVFRVIGGVFLIGYVQGQLPGVFALPAGIGDVLTGLTAPLVAYWSYKHGKGAQLIAWIWNIFGVLDFVNALTLGALAQTPLLQTEPTTALLAAMPFVLIPAFGVPRSTLLHGYTFWLLGKRRTEKQIQF